MGFSRQERWSGFLGPPPGDLPGLHLHNIKTEFRVTADSALQGEELHSEADSDDLVFANNISEDGRVGEVAGQG